MKKSLALVAAFGLGLSATPSLAQQQSAAVQYSDLDLTSPEGQEALERRIDKAAKDVCGANGSEMGTRLKSREVRSCVKSAKKQVRAQIAAKIGEDRLGG
ncbi:UrcA family protein [Alteriqipengyuania sp. 357]